MTYVVIASYPVQEALDLLISQEASLFLHGHWVKTRSHRYALFRGTLPGQGTKCVACGTEGVTMRLEKIVGKGHSSERAHFNLYDADGVMLTKDHIIPRSMGGPDSPSNYQTMCQRCNMLKSDTFLGPRALPKAFAEAEMAMHEGKIAYRGGNAQVIYVWDGYTYRKYNLVGRQQGFRRDTQDEDWHVGFPLLQKE